MWIGLKLAMGLVVAAPAAAQPVVAASVIEGTAPGGWGDAPSPAEAEAIARSKSPVRPAGDMFGDGGFQFILLPVGLILVIGRLVLAYFLRRSAPKDEVVRDYHEPPVAKWRERDLRAEARLRILEPDLPPPEEMQPVAPVAPRRDFGQRGR